MWDLKKFRCDTLLKIKSKFVVTQILKSNHESLYILYNKRKHVGESAYKQYGKTKIKYI